MNIKIFSNYLKIHKMPARAPYDKRFGHLALRVLNRASAYCYKGGNIRKIRYSTFGCWAIGVGTDATCLICHNLQDSMNGIPVCFLKKRKSTFINENLYSWKIRSSKTTLIFKVANMVVIVQRMLYWSFFRHTHTRTNRIQKLNFLC